MQALVDVIFPVFVVVGIGYMAVRIRFFDQSGVDMIMKFAQFVAIPALLFRAVAYMDLGEHFRLPLIISFYTGAIAGFTVGFVGARFLFRRQWQDSVAIGFCCLFSNSVLLGLPITERAYGPDALQANFVIIAMHAPFAYFIGITVMEVVKAGRKPATEIATTIFKAMFHNVLIVALAVGFVFNFMGLSMPKVVDDGLAMLATGGLPAALFALGGVLAGYKIQGDWRVVVYIAAVSLMLHPLVVYAVGTIAALDQASFRSAVITGAMAPGANAYIFANMYGVAKRVAASAVLFATALSLVTVWIWLLILP